MEFHERDKRNVGIRPGGTRVSARTDYRERREAISSYSLLSSDGIPVSVEGGGSFEEWQWEGGETIISARTRQKVKVASDMRLFSGGFVVIMLLLGALCEICVR